MLALVFGCLAEGVCLGPVLDFEVLVFHCLWAEQFVALMIVFGLGLDLLYFDFVLAQCYYLRFHCRLGA